MGTLYDWFWYGAVFCGLVWGSLGIIWLLVMWLDKKESK